MSGDSQVTVWKTCPASLLAASPTELTGVGFVVSLVVAPGGNPLTTRRPFADQGACSGRERFYNWEV